MRGCISFLKEQKVKERIQGNKKEWKKRRKERNEGRGERKKIKRKRNVKNTFKINKMKKDFKNHVCISSYHEHKYSIVLREHVLVIKNLVWIMDMYYFCNFYQITFLSAFQFGKCPVASSSSSMILSPVTLSLLMGTSKAFFHFRYSAFGL